MEKSCTSQKDVCQEHFMHISRELGETNVHLKALTEKINDFTKEKDAIWDKVDVHSKLIRKLEDSNLIRETRSGIIAFVVSTIVWIVGIFIQRS